MASSRRRTNPPGYRRHKTGQAFVRLAGVNHYLGRYGSTESKERYRAKLAEWAAQGGAPLPEPAAPASGEGGPSLNELIVAYWQHARDYYVKEGRPTSEQDNIRQAIRPLRKLYGMSPAREFGPKALKAVRQAMIAAGRCRKLINKDMHRIRALFRWAVEQEPLPVEALQALKAVAPLKKGRSKARERPKVRSIPDAAVEATLPHMPPAVAAMARLQRLAGMRPQEVTSIRPADVDRSDPACWVYLPARHKAEHHDDEDGRERVVFLGPKAQAILAPYLDASADPEAPLFSPRRSEDARNAVKRAARRSPMTPTHRARTRKRAPLRSPRDAYDTASYRRAIKRAWDRAFPHPTLASVDPDGLSPEQAEELKAWRARHRWHPHRLRHSAATEIRRRFGLEASQAVLGHRELGVTQVYAEKDLAKAREVMAAIG